MSHKVELTELERMALKKLCTGQINQLEWFLKRDKNGANQKAYLANKEVLEKVLEKL